MQRLWTKDYILGISINFLVMVNYYMLVVIMTDYALKFYDVSVTIAGLTAVIFIIGATLSRLICGAVMEKVGRTRMLMIFLLLNLFMSGLYFFVHNIVLLLAVRAVHGVSYGAVSTAIGTIAASVIPKSRSGEGIGYYMLSTTLAAAVGPFLGMTFHGNGGFTLLFAVCCALPVSRRRNRAPLRKRQPNAVGEPSLNRKRSASAALRRPFTSVIQRCSPI